VNDAMLARLAPTDANTPEPEATFAVVWWSYDCGSSNLLDRREEEAEGKFGNRLISSARY